MWGDSVSELADEPNNVIRYTHGEHTVNKRVVQGKHVSFKLEKEEEIEDEEEDNVYSTISYDTTKSSYSEFYRNVQSTPVDPVPGFHQEYYGGEITTNDSHTHVIQSLPQYTVQVQAQIDQGLSKILEEPWEGSSVVLEEGEEIFPGGAKRLPLSASSSSASSGSATPTNANDDGTPLSRLSGDVIIDDVYSGLNTVTTDTAVDHHRGFIDRKATLQSPPVVSPTSSLVVKARSNSIADSELVENAKTNQVLTSGEQPETSGKEVHYYRDLNITEPNNKYSSHQSLADSGVFANDEDDKLSSSSLSSLNSSTNSSASTLKSSPAPQRYNGRFSGPESETVISRSTDSVRVHSERPGGWEGISHQLVYPLSEAEWRREARRRKWQQAEAKQEVESVSFVIAVNRKSSEPYHDDYQTTFHHRTVTVADRNLPYLKPTSSSKVNSISFESSPDIYGTDDIPSKMTDKQALVERSELFEETNASDKLTKANFTPVAFELNPAYPVYAQKSPDEHDTVMSVDYNKGVGPSDVIDTSRDEKETDSSSIQRWKGRVNPFDEEEVDTDDVFTKGIIDLDHDEQPESSADQKSGHDKDNSDSERGTIPSTKSLSEAEEQINLKTQFKDAYYNIGSTEDLLKELASEDARDGDDRRKGSTISSSASRPSRDLEEDEEEEEESKDATNNEGKDNREAKTPRKGKLLKYQSIDLDIDKSNPFFDDVYQEYHRRVSTDESPGLERKPDDSRSLENIPESGSPEEAEDDTTVSDQDTHIVNTSLEATKDGDQRSDVTDEEMATMLSSGGKDQDSAPLIEDQGKDNKENMPFGFGKKKGSATELKATKPEEVSGDVENKKDDVIENGDVTKQAGNESPPQVKSDCTDADGGVTATVTSESQEATDGNAEKAEVAPTTPNNAAATPKTEKSPLITADSSDSPDSGKDSKIRDQGPGFLCCTIL